MTNFEKITEMWSRAKQTIVAPEGFKEACEDYILSVMQDKLRTDRFAISDDKYCTGVKAIVHEPMLCGKGHAHLMFEFGDGRSVAKYSLDDLTMHSLAQFMREYEVIAENITSREDETYGTIPVRQVLGLTIEPILDPLRGEGCQPLSEIPQKSDGTCGGGEIPDVGISVIPDTIYRGIGIRSPESKPVESPASGGVRGSRKRSDVCKNRQISVYGYIDSDCVYQVDTDTLYQTSDDDIVRLFAMDFGKIADLADLVLQGKGGEEFFRAVAERYLRKEIETDTYNDVYELPCGNRRFEVCGEGSPVFEKAVMVNVSVTNGKLLFAYGNGVVERIGEINVRYLWDVLDCVEYSKHLHYEDVWNKTYDLTDSNEYGKVAEEYIHRVVYSLRKSSRWFGFTKQRLMLMDKGQAPFGFFRDIICKNGKVLVEYFTCGEDDYFDLLFDAEPVEGCIKTCEFCRLSPVSMKHLVHLIGYGSGDDEDVREDYRHILCYEEWDDIVGVRVPYRIVDGKRVTTERIHDDAEMLEVARRKGIDHEVADCWFWEHTCPAEKIRDLVY